LFAHDRAHNRTQVLLILDIKILAQDNVVEPKEYDHQ
jgi:hypothetical protein